jgi:hypothetical protein
MWMPRGDARAWTGGGLSEDALALQAPDLSGGELSAVQDIIGPHTNHIILNDYAGEYAGCGAQLSPVGQEMFENLWLNPTTWGIRGGVGWLDFAPATPPPPIAHNLHHLSASARDTPTQTLLWFRRWSLTDGADSVR